MAGGSKIEWTDETLQVSIGCTRRSAGCQNCYAERFAHRGMTESHRGLTKITPDGPRWTGEVRLLPEALKKPFRWKKPRMVFVNSMSDLFHEKVPFAYIAAVFGMIARNPKHTFQLLTKCPERAAEFFTWIWKRGAYVATIPTHLRPRDMMMLRCMEEYGLEDDGRLFPPWPLANLWLGVSAENQETYDKRLPVLMYRCDAAVRWASLEPMLGPIDPHGSLGWVVAGGESGPGARPMEAWWVRDVRRACQETDTPFLFKQFGRISNNPDPADPTAKENGGTCKGGRTLDGRIWDEYPEKKGPQRA
jgi:protein gp37